MIERLYSPLIRMLVDDFLDIQRVIEENNLSYFPVPVNTESKKLTSAFIVEMDDSEMEKYFVKIRDLNINLNNDFYKQLRKDLKCYEDNARIVYGNSIIADGIIDGVLKEFFESIDIDDLKKRFCGEIGNKIGSKKLFGIATSYVLSKPVFVLSQTVRKSEYNVKNKYSIFGTGRLFVFENGYTKKVCFLDVRIDEKEPIYIIRRYGKQYNIYLIEKNCNGEEKIITMEEIPHTSL